MPETIYKIHSISEMHNLLEIGKPNHPLISVVRHTPDMRLDFEDVRFAMDLYFISLKEKIAGTFVYGRNAYDFQEGTMVFTAPGQVIQSQGKAEPDLGGWSIVFHPNLIRRSHLGNTMSLYSYFQYGLHEALHLSEREKQNLSDLVKNVEREIDMNTDRHSQDLIIHNLETILKYCLRYYNRQFSTRTNQNKDVIIAFEQYLDSYFARVDRRHSAWMRDSSGELMHLDGVDSVPSVEDCGRAMNMSGRYLSDMLKAETGKTVLEHVHYALIERAKTILLNSNFTVSEIAYAMGFKYRQYFNKS
jgi:AraC-type DNA-binding domain-containing proteins